MCATLPLHTGEAVESDLAVVVIVTRHPHASLLGEACPAVGARRTATAALATPLGDRVVLDLQQGPHPKNFQARASIT